MRANDVRLLILDDDSDVASVIRTIAEASGADARVATDADEFFDQVDAFDPTHVTVDLIMPNVDGIEVLRRLGDRAYDGVVIIASGLDRRVLASARRSAAEHGLRIAGFLPKPFKAADLRAMLTERPDRALGSTGAAPDPDRHSLLTDALRPEGIAAAIEQRAIHVAFQPKLHLEDGALAGFEALARWTHPRLGAIRPDLFIAAAEAAGRIDDVTFQVFDSALAWFATHASDTPETRLSLNLSARSLVHVAWADDVAELCDRYEVPPSRVILELTETNTAQDQRTALDVLTRLRIKGFPLSIDDFGTGHSTLVQLARQPFSELKIDQAFVRDLQDSQEAQSIVRAVLGLAHALGLSVTAEGVEDAGALAFLRTVGCDQAQGFHIARPLAPEAARAWIRAGGAPEATVRALFADATSRSDDARPRVPRPGPSRSRG